MIVENILDKPDTILILTDKAASFKKHRNYKNYKNFEKRLENYKAFHIVKNDDEILCFAGIYKDPLWPNNILRVCDRMFTFPKFRVNKLGSYNSPTRQRGYKKEGLLTSNILPLQVKLVQEWGAVPFASVQDLRRRPAFKSWLETRVDPNLKLKLLPKLHFTCGHNDINNRNCWQNIAATEEVDLPSISFEDYRRL
tara:strand:+ start:3592 stop:4179 length:588 start_codon:yes stop_codon:yes gene_type:complete